MNRAQSPANVLVVGNDSSPISGRIVEHYDSPQVLYNQMGAIGYASWGSHDHPAYCRARNLAESYYLAIPRLSWRNIVVGDSLCSLGRP